jgi:hypothetical protein
MIARWVWINGVVAVLASAVQAQDAALAPSVAEPEWGDPCALFTPDATYVTSTILMDIEGREVNLRIPVAYFEDPWDQEDGLRTTAQLFSVEIGSFLPVTRPQTKVKMMAGLQDFMTFLAGDFITLPKIAEFHVNVNLGPPDPPLSSYTRHVGPYGLFEIKTSKIPEAYPAHDVYISEEEDGIIQAVLDCNAPNTYEYPGCDHFFSTEGMDINIHYRLTYLPYWKSIQKSISEFMTCATPDNRKETDHDNAD